MFFSVVKIEGSKEATANELRKIEIPEINAVVRTKNNPFLKEFNQSASKKFSSKLN